MAVKSNQFKYGNFNAFDRMETRMGPMTAAQMIKNRTKMSGAEAGRAARFTALDNMIRRRQQIRGSQQGSPGGIGKRGQLDLSEDEMDKLIKGKG